MSRVVLNLEGHEYRGVNGRLIVPKGTPYMSKSKTDEWGTPQDLFDALNDEFGFTLDACASAENHKCERYITAEQNALTTPWGHRSDHVFFNPPHSLLKEFLLRAEDMGRDRLVVGLIPARTDTYAWHHAVMLAEEVRLIEGRLKFGGAKDGAPFPSAVVVWTPRLYFSGCAFYTADRLGRIQTLPRESHPVRTGLVLAAN